MSIFGDAKRAARRAVHDALAGAASYEDGTLTEPVALAVRWHNRQVVDGGGDGFAAVVEGLNRLIFDADELASKGVTLRRNGTVTLADYDDMVVSLDIQRPSDGPIGVVWDVVRVEPGV